MAVRVVGALLLACLSMLPQLAVQPSIAEAQSDDERARMHFQAGRSYFDQRRLEDALREFNEAYRLSERAALLLNIATVLERLERLDEAADTVDRYLDLEPDADDRRTLTERAASMRALAAEQRAEAEAATTTDTAPDPPDDPGADTPSSASGGGMGTLGLVGIIVAGVGVAAVVPTVAFGVISEDHYQRVQTECSADGTCPASVQDSLEEGPLFADISTAMLFVSIGLVAAGAALFTVDLVSGGDDASGEAASEDAEAEVTAQLDVGPGSLALRGSF
ncbi:MAG: hypothetical protein AB8I08_13505 [Sandaracinaceae bacterium]